MSTTATPGTRTGRGALTERLLGGNRSRRLVYLLVGLVVLMSAVRVISG